MKKQIKRTIRVVITASYEIDWATERSDPINVYLELEAQPLTNNGKTINEVIQAKNIRDMGEEQKKKYIGTTTIQRNKEIPREK